MAPTNEENSEETLEALFSRGLDIHSEIESSSEDTNSKEFQLKVRKAILLLEDATRLVSALDLFSRNETVSEVATSSLKYFLLPVILGDLNGKLVEGHDRSELLQIIETYYIDFLQRVKDYEIMEDLKVPKPMIADEPEPKPAARGGPPDLGMMNREREAKIHRYKEKKMLEAKLKELKVAVDHPSCDDDVARDFYVSTIKKFALSALDELESIKQESEILRHIASMPKRGAEAPKRQPSRPLKPIILTRDSIQKHVFGLGYPSLPVMSIEEFYDDRARKGWYDHPKPDGPSLMDRAMKDGQELVSQDDEEARQKEEKEDHDDEEELARKRNWDEFKDDHRRGEGNRKNMG